MCRMRLARCRARTDSKSVASVGSSAAASVLGKVEGSAGGRVAVGEAKEAVAGGRCRDAAADAADGGCDEERARDERSRGAASGLERASQQPGMCDLR